MTEFRLQEVAGLTILSQTFDNDVGAARAKEAHNRQPMRNAVQVVEVEIQVLRIVNKWEPH